MKRKLLFNSAVIPALLACAANAQVVNFHDSFNYALYQTPAVPAGFVYNALFAGQGAYPDPGNNIWNGFAQHNNGFQSEWYYSGGPGSGPPSPQQAGNPGNPYACYGGISAGGLSLFNFNTCGLPTTGNANSAGQMSPITFSGSFNGDFGGVYYQNQSSTPELNGSPEFLLSSCSVVNGGSPNVTVALGNVPPGTYGLYIYDSTEFNDRGATFSLESANGGVSHNGINTAVNEDNPDGVPDLNGYVEGGNFVIFENVVPDANGNIVITGTPITNPYSGNSGESDLAAVQLIFNPLPTEVGLNAAANVYSGGTATFSFSPVFADEDSVMPSYQWQFSGNGGTNWTDVGPDSPTLTIAGATSANAGLYQCLITDNVTSAVGTTPVSSLAILSNPAGNILQTGDVLTDVNNSVGFPGNTVPESLFMTVNNVEDQTLYQYENFGVNGNSTTTGFTGPAGFIVTPVFGRSLVTGIRLFASSSHPEADPANYQLQGAQSPGGPWTIISSGSLSLPLARNAAGGPINVSNESLQEINFANTGYYTSYQLTFNDVRNDSLDTNGVQIAEVQLLGVSVPGASSFNSVNSGWTLNEGSGIDATITNNQLLLTDGNGSEADSAFLSNPQYIGGFIASYTYQVTPGGPWSFGEPYFADGMTFCVHNDPNGAYAVGESGGSLGYNGIENSAAFEMNIFSDGTSDPNNVGIVVGLDGACPDASDNESGPVVTTAPVDITSGHPIYVNLYYMQNAVNGGALKVLLQDVTTGDIFTTNFIGVDLPGAVGGDTAYVGFTGSDGAWASYQVVKEFIYSPSTPPILAIANGSTPGTVVVSWPNTVSPYFTLLQGTGINGPWSPVNATPSVVNGNYQVTLAAPGKAAYYILNYIQTAP